jgi:succinyl-diaminopimelate desuccinylase
MFMLNPVKLAQKLIQFVTVTPNDQGCQSFIHQQLAPYGFILHDLSTHGVTNTFLIKGSGPLILISAHTDVVPATEGNWQHPPFCGIIDNNMLYGRGACDMKGALAAMMTALSQISPQHCAIGLALTSDEEGPSEYGSKIITDWLNKQGLHPECTLIIEPTSNNKLGDNIKTGRRGSLYADISISPKANHVAYLPSDQNPVFEIMKMISALANLFKDPAINFHLVKISAGHANNVTPHHFQMRFNWRHDASLPVQQIKKLTQELLLSYDAQISWTQGADPYQSQSNLHAKRMRDIIQQSEKLTPTFTHTGGASDGRFFALISKEIFEFGLVNQTIHQANECTSIQDIETLSNIYLNWLEQTDESFASKSDTQR